MVPGGGGGDDVCRSVSDAVMNPYSLVEVARRGYQAAEWSPGGGDDVCRSVLDTVMILNHQLRWQGGATELLSGLLGVGMKLAGQYKML